MTRGQSDGPKNFYAISKGRRTGIFKGVAWSEVKPLVDGFSGNAYKGFVTIEEAIEFMKKGGFSDSDIHIYDNVMSNDAVKGSAEPASPTTDAANAAPDNGDMIDTSDTEIKFFDAEMLNDIDRVSRNEPNTSTAVSESTENAQCSASSDQRKPYCVICSCDENKEMLQCSQCNGRVHLTCTGLPIYQIKVYRNTQRKYMCQLCVENSVEIQTKDARKSYSEPIPNEIVSGVPVPQDTNLSQPATSSVHIVSQAEDIADVKREVGTIKLTLANFENEMLKIVTQMRDENVMLREKVCDEKIHNTNEEKCMVLKQLEKIENTNKDLITQNMNLKDNQRCHSHRMRACRKL